MRIVICCNHTYPHCGGSEKVVKQISDSMASAPYNHEVIVLSGSIPSQTKYGNVTYIPCKLNKEGFLSLLQKLNPDHTHVYSDYFAHWSTVLYDCDKIPGKKSIALVGMNYMMERNADLIQLKRKQGQISVITHSDNYQDYLRCRDDGIGVTVIPNGIDLKEFDSVEPDTFPWAEGRRVILCVSNFFPGKGQEYLLEILRRLKTLRQDDWVALFVSTTVNYFLAQMLSERLKRQLNHESFKSRFVVDQSREDTLKAFRGSSVFAFPTQKEVAPIVALEAQACSLPWVALPVGNLPQLRGGLMAPTPGKDPKGNMKYNNLSYDIFASHINKLLSDEEFRKKTGAAGREQIEKEYNWDLIANKYHEVFIK